MRLFTKIILKVTLILPIINLGDGFMFSAWLRSTTEQNLSTLGPNKQQNYAPNEAHSAPGAYRYVYAPKKDSGKAIVADTSTTPLRATNTPSSPTDKDVIAAYNNQRTGISPPPVKYDKPWNVFDAVVVHSIPSAGSVVPSPASPSISYVAIPAYNYPYLYYRNEPKAQPASIATTATPAPQKSVHVELNYKDDTVVEKIGENVVLNPKIPSAALLDSVRATESSSAVSITSVTAAAANSSSPSLVSDSSSKVDLPNRPIKLLGPNTTPQFYYAPAAAAADIQYVHYPFLRSPLVSPFLYKNTPRAVSERSEIALPPPSAFPATNSKLEKPVCENCVLPSALSDYSHALNIFNNNENAAFQKPCAPERAGGTAAAAVHANTAIAPNFKSSNMAYVLVPSQFIANRAT